MTEDTWDGDRTGGGLHAPTTMGMTPGAERRGRGGGRPGWRWALWALTLLAIPAVAWLDQLLRHAGLAELAWLHLSSIPQTAAAVSAATVGAVLASPPAPPPGGLAAARPGAVADPVGPDLRRTPATGWWPGRGRCRPPATWPGSTPASPSSGSSCASFVLLLTPTGSLPSPRWRWWARVAAAAAVVWLLASVVHPAPLYPEFPAIGNPLAVPFLPRGLLDVAQPAAGVVILVSLVVGAVSLVGRFRRARGTERQQLRWLAWGAALAAVALLVALTGLFLLDSATLVDVALGVCTGLLPLATGAAILRYRLYDLDRIISRTLAYGLLTVLLGLGYAVVVLGLGRLLPQDSSLVVAGATLAVAGAFQPARGRVQRVVDRRFNRRRYNAAQTIATFSARLREELDLDTLTGELLAVVEQTTQPTQVSLWLRPPQAPAGTAGDAVARHRT